MELRSKSQREAVGPDVADRDLSGEAVIRLAHDPSPPVLSPVRFQTTPVLSDSNTDDAEQRQEHAHTTPESGTLTKVTATVRDEVCFDLAEQHTVSAPAAYFGYLM